MIFWPFYIKNASAHHSGIIGRCRYNGCGLAHTFPAGQIARRGSTNSAGPYNYSFLIIPDTIHSQFHNTPSQQPLTFRSFSQPPIIMALPIAWIATYSVQLHPDTRLLPVRFLPPSSQLPFTFIRPYLPPWPSMRSGDRPARYSTKAACSWS